MKDRFDDVCMNICCVLLSIALVILVVFGVHVAFNIDWDAKPRDYKVVPYYQVPFVPMAR